jgi:hypothetical protein
MTGWPTCPRSRKRTCIPANVVTLAVLFAPKGGGERLFCHWLTRDHRSLFPHLPECTRLFRLFATHQAWAGRFLADRTVLEVTDIYGIEVLHPRRERRGSQEQQPAWAQRLVQLPLDHRRQTRPGAQPVEPGLRLGRDHRQCPRQRLPDLGHRFAETMVVLVDHSFGRAEANQATMQVYPRGTLNERLAVETTCSMLTLVCHLKKVVHRVWDYFTIRLAFPMATFNLLVQWDGTLPCEDPGYLRRSIAHVRL